MALVCAGGSASGGKRFIAVASEARVEILEEDERLAQTVSHVTLSAAVSSATSNSDECVVAMTIGCQGRLLAVCTSEKHLVVWEWCGEWRVSGERTVPKRVTALQISEGEEYLLTSDKTGAVIRYHVSDLGHDAGEELLGHLSMILDMVMVSCDSHVITCDRDEKIRVSRYPNCYNIETYCLGHTEFVSCLCLCEKWPHLLISGSGDSSVRCWEWRKGILLDTHHCSVDQEKVPPVTVTQVVCSRHTEQEPLIVAIVEGSAELVVLQLSSEGTFKCLFGKIPLSVSPWSCVFDWSNRLWACLPDEQEPVQCWQFESGCWQRCSSVIEGKLSNWDLFKNCKESKEWGSLRKNTFDNMSDYLTRKKERIQQRAVATRTAAAVVAETRCGGAVVKTAATEVAESTGGQSVVSTVPEVVETTPEPPPEKKMKMHVT